MTRAELHLYCEVRQPTRTNGPLGDRCLKEIGTFSYSSIIKSVHFNEEDAPTCQGPKRRIALDASLSVVGLCGDQRLKHSLPHLIEGKL